MSRIDDLITERATLWESNKNILDLSDTENRDCSGEEQQQWEKQTARIDECNAHIERHDKQREQDKLMEEGEGRLTNADSGLNEPTGAPVSPTAAGGDPIEAKVTYKGEALDRNHPGYASLVERSTAEYQKQMDAYLRTGQIGAVLKTTDDASGGTLTTTQMLNQLVKFMDDAVFMRQLGTVLPPLVRAISLGVPTWDTDPSDYDWTAEVPASDISEDTAPRTGNRELTPHLCTKRVDISQKLLRASVIPMEQLLMARLAYKHGITEENAFQTGDGADQPLGAWTASANGVSTGRDVAGVGAAPAFDANDFSNLLMSLKPQYQARSTFVLHRDGVKKVMQLTDGFSNYIWQPGLKDGSPNTILGRPYVQSENAPNTYTATNYAVMCADWSFYWIVDSLQFTIQRLDEIAALQNKVVFLGRKETDGMPILEEAFARLQMTA